jgi:ubiquitin C-terminal hydrolase
LGFENDSNVCYANSSLHVLYHCIPFREQVILWKPCNKEKFYLLNELQDLFKSIYAAKESRGIINHRRFIARIRAGNALFNNDEHHDSHEFISWLIDEIHMNISEDFQYYLRKKI